MASEIYKRGPAEALREHLDGGLKSGQVGIIAAPAGVGKSALLIHFAMDGLLRGVTALHVALKDTVDNVRAHYDELLGAASRSGGLRDRSAAQVIAERRRMIHSYRERTFSVEHLRSNLKMLSDVAQFRPAQLVIDGLEAGTLSSTVLGELTRLAVDFELVIWLTLRTLNDGLLDEAMVNTVSRVLILSSDDRSVRIGKQEGARLSSLPVHLDPTSLLVLGDDLWGEHEVLSPRPTDCTLYSGGAKGAEEAFGAVAERWDLHEVNFTFDGHKQARSRGHYELSSRELAAGDVSLVYVSRRLNRTYSEGSLIRKVLQTLWHMVSRSQQVFVIGQIQDDGTVVGGTGWSVELARMWNKALWVFDQEQSTWFRWDGSDWVQGTPIIESIHITGTGTRYLTAAGEAAINDLFKRSFRARMTLD